MWACNIISCIIVTLSHYFIAVKCQKGAALDGNKNAEQASVAGAAQSGWHKNIKSINRKLPGVDFKTINSISFKSFKNCISKICLTPSYFGDAPMTSIVTKSKLLHSNKSLLMLIAIIVTWWQTQIRRIFTLSLFWNWARPIVQSVTMSRLTW